jgi:hypothetical protein
MLENWILLVIAVVIIVIIIAIFLFLSPSNNTPIDPTLPSAKNSTVTISPNQVIANNIDTFTATVVVKDGNKEPITGTNITMTSSSTDVTIQRTSDQEQTFTIKSKTAGKFTIITTADGIPINAKDITFIPVGQVPQKLSTTFSTVVADPTSVVNGGSSRITVTLLDTTGKSFNGVGVSEVALRANETFTETSVDQELFPENVFKFIVSADSDFAGPITFTASVNGTALQQTATVTFTEKSPPIVGQKFSNQSFTNFAIPSPPDPLATITAASGSLTSNTASVADNVTTFSPLAGQTFTVTRTAGNTPPNLQVTSNVNVGSLQKGQKIKVDITHNGGNDLVTGEAFVTSGGNFTRDGFPANIPDGVTITLTAQNAINTSTIPLSINFSVTPPFSGSASFSKILDNVQLKTVYTLL